MRTARSCTANLRRRLEALEKSLSLADQACEEMNYTVCSHMGRNELESLIDAMLEMPMEEVLEKIPLDHATKAVLLGQPSELRPVFQLMLAHESGEWQAAAELSQRLHLDSEDVAAYYWQAQQWAREVSNLK